MPTPGAAGSPAPSSPPSAVGSGPPLTRSVPEPVRGQLLKVIKSLGESPCLAWTDDLFGIPEMPARGGRDGSAILSQQPGWGPWKGGGESGEAGRAPETPPNREETLLSAPLPQGTAVVTSPASASGRISAPAAETEAPGGGPRGWEVLPSHVAGPSGHSGDFSRLLQDEQWLGGSGPGTQGGSHGPEQIEQGQVLRARAARRVSWTTRVRGRGIQNRTQDQASHSLGIMN